MPRLVLTAHLPLPYLTLLVNLLLTETLTFFMRRILLCTTCAGLIVLSGMQLHAQIKGDPELKATAQMPAIQKQGSKISPELQRVYDNTANARKAQPSGEKPMTTNDALDIISPGKG